MADTHSPASLGCGVVLLMGPPGVGKSSLGAALAADRALAGSGSTTFCNVGQVLREEGMLSAGSTQPLGTMRTRARQVLSEACSQLTWQAWRQEAASSSTAPRPQHVLVCEFVNELADVFTFLELLEEHGLPLLLVRGARAACIEGGREAAVS
jgi:hypothetical protein